MNNRARQDTLLEGSTEPVATTRILIGKIRRHIEHNNWRLKMIKGKALGLSSTRATAGQYIRQIATTNQPKFAINETRRIECY